MATAQLLNSIVLKKVSIALEKIAQICLPYLLIFASPSVVDDEINEEEEDDDDEKEGHHGAAAGLSGQFLAVKAL